MNCKNCKSWNSDGFQNLVMIRAVCSENRAEKTSETTIFDYCCRYYQPVNLSEGE